MLPTMPDQSSSGASWRRELAAALRDKRAKVGVVGLGYVGLPMLVSVVRAGFRGVGVDLYQTRVDALVQGRSYITPLITKGLIGTLLHPEAHTPARELTPRQREVLQLLAEGHSMKQAAAILNVSPRTIAFHKYRMMEHLHVQSTAALMHFAVREGLI